MGVPLPADRRIASIDVLRGLALLFILIENIALYSGHPYSLENASCLVDRVIIVGIFVLFQTTSYSLLSLLFGWGIGQQLARGGRFRVLHLRRMGALLLFGLVHGLLIWYGDVLVLYAALGLLMLLFLKWRPRALLIAAIAFLLLPVALNLPGEAMDGVRAEYEHVTAALRSTTYPESLYREGSYFEVLPRRAQDLMDGISWAAYYFGSMFGMFLLGLWLARRGVFAQVECHRPAIRMATWMGLGIGLLFNELYIEVLVAQGEGLGRFGRLAEVGTRTVGGAAFVVFYVGLIVLLMRRERARQALAPLAFVGRTSLSNYLFQSVICTALFYGYGLGLYGQVGPLVNTILAVTIYWVEVRLSEWWLARYRYGPAEWVWRMVAYGHWLPLRRGQGTGFWGRACQWASRLDRRVLYAALALLLIGGAVAGAWYTRSSEIEVVLAPVQRREADRAISTLVPAARAAVERVVATPVVQPVPYAPGPAAASGDLYALARAFDAQAALTQVKTLTGPPYLGRYPASFGGRAAGTYIADRFAEYGLQPAGEDGTYYQSFVIEYLSLEGVPSLTIEGPGESWRRGYEVYEDFAPIVRQYAGEGEARGGVVWADDCSRQDLGAISVVGKVVLCRDGTPLEAERHALEHGASGLLLLADPARRPPDFGTTYGEAWVPEPLPVLRVYPSLVEDLLQDSGVTIQELSTAFTPFALETVAHIAVDTGGSERCPATGCVGRNVLGVIPGRDPAHASEVVVLGAHYDHLGESPDGTAWVGANDNASGVAVLLEIARTWQAQGYVPRRTVLFAAWDAEEMGLIGSRHFVSHPQYPLEQIVAMLQLDMVGAGGDVLRIDGSQDLGKRLAAAADAVGVEIAFSEEGRSDHVPFWQAGIPASLLIWTGDADAAPTYHRPVDKSETVSLDKLDAVGMVAGIGMLGLTEGELAIADLLDARAAAVERGEVEAFVQTSAPDQQVGDRYWFADLQALAPLEVEMAARDVHVQGRTASAMVHIEARFRGAGSEKETVLRGAMRAEFVHQEGAWSWAGPNLDRATGDGDRPFVVFYPPGREEGVAELAQRATERSQQVTALLGLPHTDGVSLQLMPSLEALRTATALSGTFDEEGWVSPGLVRLAYSPHISTSTRFDDALVRLALAEAGVNREAASWLWEGLPLAVRSALTGERAVALGEVQAALDQEGAIEGAVAAWAATEYLRQQIGWEGIGRLAIELGGACRVGGCEEGMAFDRILDQRLQLEGDTFAVAWQRAWRTRLAAMQAGVDDVLSARAEAVLARDRDAFLATVYDGVPHLVEEQALWFDEAMRHFPQAYTLSGSLIEAQADGTLLVRVLSRYREGEAEAAERVVTLPIRFVPAGEGYRWAGTPLERTAQDGMQVLYPAGQDAAAAAHLEQAVAIYAVLADALGMAQPAAPVVKLYDDTDAFRSSIGPSLEQVRGVQAWMNQGASIKLLIDRSGDLQGTGNAVSVQLAQYLLRDMGVSAEWLIQGTSVYLARQAGGDQIERAVTADLESIVLEAREGVAYDLNTMSFDDQEAHPESERTQTYAWDAVRYLVYNYGYDTLLSLLKAQAEMGDLNGVMQTVLGQDMDAFTGAWTASLARDHADPVWVDTAAAFEADRAYAEVEALSGQAMRGRQPGSAEAMSAAAYVARSFAASGLIPVSSEPDTGYMQRFPISYTILLEAPILELAGDGDRVWQTLTYRADFVLPRLAETGWGDVEGELVWVNDATYRGLQLDDKIAVRVPSRSLDQEVAMAQAHGAAGLIVVGKIAGEKRPWAKQALPVTIPVSRTIPVLELTRPGYERLLDAVGQTDNALHDAPSALPLEIQARIAVRLSTPEPREAVNVLGLLPGADPAVADEVIILSAHYDHVGDDPDGWRCPAGVSAWTASRDALCTPVEGARYPGANDNASGVAVMLEIARLWQERGYRPGRSVLLAAWGAHEVEQRGLAYYLDHPAFPLQDTYAVLHLDAVGGGEGYYLGAQGSRAEEGTLRAALQAAEEELDGRLTLMSPPKADDPSAALRRARVPTLWLTWRESSEANWPVQYADIVEPYRLGVTGKMVTLGLMILAR